MKYSITILLLLLLFVFTELTFSQIPQFQARLYSQPMQLDSSSQSYLIGILPTKANKDKYIPSQIPQYDYTGSVLNGWTNIILYNSDTRKSVKLFPDKDFVSISPVSGAYAGIASSYNNQNLSIAFSKFLLLSVKTDYNRDDIIDDNDPVSLFFSSKTGTGLTQLTPKDATVISWTLSMNGKVIMAKIVRDKNGDKIFKNEEEEIYQIDLDNDFSKIKSTVVTLN